MQMKLKSKIALLLNDDIEKREWKMFAFYFHWHSLWKITFMHGAHLEHEKRCKLFRSKNEIYLNP